MKTFATKTPRHQEPFYNKPLGVPLCLRAFVAIFTVETIFKVFGTIFNACPKRFHYNAPRSFNITDEEEVLSDRKP
jgi:hypothetical protein